MNKKIIVILVNLFLLAVIYFSFEFMTKKFVYSIPHVVLFENKEEKDNKVDIKQYETEELPSTFKLIPTTVETENEFCGERRVEIGEKYKKLPIVILGCSYAYGHGLKKEKTFPYVLSEITQRPVYNYSNCGGHGFGSLVFFLHNIDTENSEETNKFKYFIYIYMWDHINRYMTIDFWMRYYNLFQEPTKTDKFLEKFYLLNYLNMKFKIRQIMSEYPNSEQSSLIQKKIMLYMYQEIKKISPDAKLIIIIYDEKIPDWRGGRQIKYVSDVMNSHIWKELEEETKGGIKVIHTKELTGFVFDKDWKLEADICDWHPNEKVWTYFTPLFAKKYIK